MELHLDLLPEQLAVARLDPSDTVPDRILGSSFVSVTRTRGELSVVAPESALPETWRREGGWRALRVAGPLDFALTGVLASLTGPLAAAGVPVFTISTFDTDYILVPGRGLPEALAALRSAGHTIGDAASD